MLIQDSDSRFTTQLHVLSEMGFTDSQANIEGKEIIITNVCVFVRLSFKCNIYSGGAIA